MESTGAELQLSKTQIIKMTKTGAFLPLLKLLSMLLGGLSAADWWVRVHSQAVDDNKAANATLAEAEIHNREVEAQLKAVSALYLYKK